MNSQKQLKILADNVRQFRARERMTQEQLAEKSFSSQQYIWEIENERANPSLSVLLNIANALRVTVKDLV